MTNDTRKTIATAGHRIVVAVGRKGAPGKVIDALAAESGLPKLRIKDAMAKGAVWVWRGKNRQRLRRATAPLSAGTRVSLFYDPAVLALTPPPARLLVDFRDYSAWLKPAGLLTQGTDYGDHCSLLRQAQSRFTPRREALPVHRLDREAAGLVLVAHTSAAAAALSGLFRDHRIVKRYRAVVLGCPESLPQDFSITLPLDGKPALTRVRFVAADPARNTATADIEIETGRKHQIRRHLELAGYPVMGDPRYGSGNKNAEGMQLTAVALEFTCPIRRRPVVLTLPEGDARP